MEIIAVVPDGQVIPPIDPRIIDVCNRIAVGSSVAAACKDIGIAHETFYDALRGSELVAQEYARARAARADYRFESMDSVIEDMRTGLIDPITARVQLDSIKWQCGKEKAKVYGDSTTIKGDKDNPLTLQALSSALDDRVKGRIETDKT